MPATPPQTQFHALEHQSHGIDDVLRAWNTCDDNGAKQIMRANPHARRVADLMMIAFETWAGKLALDADGTVSQKNRDALRAAMTATFKDLLGLTA